MSFWHMPPLLTLEAFKQNPLVSTYLALTTINPVSISFVVVLLTTVLLRILYILPYVRPQRPIPRKVGTPTRLMVVLGSGGHTAEMLLMLKGLDRTKFTRRSYVVTAGDKFSAAKAIELEDELDADDGIKPADRLKPDGTKKPRGFDVTTLPRPRKIHESAPSAVVNTFRCFMACLFALRGNTTKALRQAYGSGDQYPDVIVCNGPGICVCMAAAVLYAKFWGYKCKTRIIYVESFARVKTLSLTGKLMRYTADCFVVQWQELADRVKGEYHGKLVLGAALR